MYGEQVTVVSGDYNGTTVPCRHRNGDELQNRQQALSQNFQNLEQFNAAKGQLEQNISQYQAAITQLQSQRQANGVLQVQQQITQYKDQMGQLEQNSKFIQNSLLGLAQKILCELTEYTRLCENLIINWTKDELIIWKQQQKIAQYGGPDSLPSLATLTQRYQTMTDYVFTAWKFVQRGAPILRKLVNSQQVNAVHTKLFSLFYQLLNTSFLVVHQPPMIAKNRITVRVGLLGAIDKFGFETQRTTAQCRVINEDTAADLKRNPEKIDNADIKTCGKLDEDKMKEKEIERLRMENVLGFEYKNFKVKVDSRKTSAKDGEAIKKKYYLLFSCTVTIGDQPFKIFSLSHPFMVSVHGSQDKDLWAKAFWDMAFSDGLSEIPMRGRPEVQLSELLTGLKNVFSCIINANMERKLNEPLSSPDRKLNDNDLAYIKLRMFNGQLPVHYDPMISWSKFFTEPLYHMSSRDVKLDFSLWEWFFRIADMLQEKAGHEVKAKALWNLNLLEGFISKSEADHRLSTCSRPTMLLRFSDNNLQSVSVVVRKGDGEIDHLAPFKNKEDITEKMSLPACIIRCEQLENVDFVFPSQSKKLIEGQISHPKQLQSQSQSGRKGYKHCTIKMVNEGDEEEHEQRKASFGSSPSTPGNSFVGSPATADLYSPKPFIEPKFQVPNFGPQNLFPTESYNDKKSFDNSFYNQTLLVPGTSNNQQFVDNDSDIIMTESELLEIFEDIQKHENFFENMFDNDMH